MDFKFTFKNLFAIGALLLTASNAGIAQSHKSMFDAILKEGMQEKSLAPLAHQFIDVIGPRLVGSPQMQQAHDFLVKQYQSWGISAYNEQWGTWDGWTRGFTHVDLVSPRATSMEAIQMAWCPNMSKPLTASVALLPNAVDSVAFAKLLPQLKGKYVLISAPQTSGRPLHTIEAFLGKAGLDSVTALRKEAQEQWAKRIARTGHTLKKLPQVLEAAGAAGIIQSSWTDGWGALKVFGARTKTIPMVEMGLEDYNLLVRLCENGTVPQIRVFTSSKHGKKVPAYNTMAVVKGKEKPDEIVMLSAHMDSWDAGTGATDNGTGVLTMMEAMRILKKVYPQPKRTIMVGHWGSEEQGLNGSRGFVEDHPELLDKISLVLNQDNGTGKINSIATQGLVNAYTFFEDLLAYMPQQWSKDFKMVYPGFPDVGGSDNMAFLPLGIPAFYLASTNDWDYRKYTWHTQRDTYDKIIFDELRQNAITVAMMTYLACEAPELMDRKKINMPIDITTGKPKVWPKPGKATRTGPIN